MHSKNSWGFFSSFLKKLKKNVVKTKKKTASKEKLLLWQRVRPHKGSQNVEAHTKEEQIEGQALWESLWGHLRLQVPSQSQQLGQEPICRFPGPSASLSLGNYTLRLKTKNRLETNHCRGPGGGEVHSALSKMTTTWSLVFQDQWRVPSQFHSMCLLFSNSLSPVHNMQDDILTAPKKRPDNCEQVVHKIRVWKCEQDFWAKKKWQTTTENLEVKHINHK